MMWFHWMRMWYIWCENKCSSMIRRNRSEWVSHFSFLFHYFPRKEKNPYPCACLAQDSNSVLGSLFEQESDVTILQWLLYLLAIWGWMSGSFSVFDFVKNHFLTWKLWSCFFFLVIFIQVLFSLSPYGNSNSFLLVSALYDMTVYLTKNLVTLHFLLFDNTISTSSSYLFIYLFCSAI